LLLPAPADLAGLRAAARPFVTGALAREPRRYFAFVEQPPDGLVSSTRYRRRLAGGAIVGRAFASRYRPYGGAGRAPGAESILVEHWMHGRSQPRGTVLALHGFGMGQPRLDAWALFAAAWFGRGLDVALLTLPHHGARSLAGARFSGQRFAQADPAQLNEAVRQAIYEIHAVRGWLRASSARPVGLIGLSLGGYLAALYASLDAELDFVVPIVPPVCFGDLGARFSARRGEAAEAPYAPGELQAMFRVHSPLSHRLRTPAARALIVAGRGDRIVPPEHPQALWRHWQQPSIHWFSGSHLAPFGRRGVVDAIAAHLGRLGIL
ncbi:MAG: alpha/beta fold hydrolase, partial [Candidatus Binatia bacterium]